MFENERSRRVIPRWRSSWLTAKTLEAKSIKQPLAPDSETNQKHDLEISQKINELNVYKSVPVASELMFLASSLGNETAAKQAAEVILGNREKIKQSHLLRTAEKVLNGGELGQVVFESKKFVKNARELLAIDYRNPILLIDMARELVALREIKSAHRYVRAAVAMSPNSRFVLRSAARYYLHIGNFEIAHDILRRSHLFKTDPWIQASEVAIATMLGKTSTLAKQAIKHLSEVKNISVEFTELTSALGTLELLSGSRKKAKILFNHSLINPNDNSLAQAEWAATKLKLVVEDKALKMPLSYEANSHNAYRHQDIAKAIEDAKSWAKDEPFASRPMNSLCYLLSLEGQYSDALAFATEAHKLDNDDLGTALNYLFVQIQAGDIEIANEGLHRLGNHPDIKLHAPQYAANAGALAYAFGEFEKARNFYQLSINYAKSKGDTYSEALARAFYARIATEAKDPLSESIVKESAEIVPRLPSIGAIYIVQSLVDTTTKNKLQSIATSRVAKTKWHWNSVTNTLSKIDS